MFMLHRIAKHSIVCAQIAPQGILTVGRERIHYKNLLMP